jgi:hypothetical protein
MVTHKRINITIHPIELKKLDKIAAQHNETRSGMITRLIQEHKEISDYDSIGEKTEMSYYAPENKKKDKVK